jgi:hypothetical protein
MTFTVVLAVLRHGATIGSTCDDFDADSAEEAERLAIAAWKAAEPALTFRPLLTMARPASAG